MVHVFTLICLMLKLPVSNMSLDVQTLRLITTSLTRKKSERVKFCSQRTERVLTPMDVLRLRQTITIPMRELTTTLASSRAQAPMFSM